MGLSLAHPLWPWAAGIVAAGLVALLAWWALGPRRRPRDGSVLVAGTAALRTLARYRALAGRHRRRALLRVAAALVVVAGCGLVLVRPQAVAVEPRTARSRDIMLCLDASGSMDAYDAAVVDEARQIVAHLHGDRIGLMIWSSATVQVFPLTDDYGYVATQLDRAESGFSGRDKAFYAGVDLVGKRASLIGDGIVSCVDRFDRLDQQRSRAVVVASDNAPIGTPAYSLAAAAAYAKAHHVLLYGIGAPSLNEPGRAAARKEFADATAVTGGSFSVLDGAGSAAGIVDRIDDLEKARAAQPPHRVSHDDSGVGVLVAGVGMALLLLGWAAEAGAGFRRRRTA